MLIWGTGEIFPGISVTPSMGAGHWLFSGLWLLTGGGLAHEGWSLFFGSL